MSVIVSCAEIQDKNLTGTEDTVRFVKEKLKQYFYISINK